jgi:hypothetical protein
MSTPLMHWQQIKVADAKRHERALVIEQLEQVRPNSHKAVELRFALRQLTRELLIIEQDMQHETTH